MMLASLVFLLTTCSMGALLLAALYPRISGASALDQRFDLIAEAGPMSQRTGATQEVRRKRSVEATLREADERQKVLAQKKAKPSLLLRMRQGGLAWTPTTYYLVCCATGTAVFLVVMATLGIGMLPALGFGLSAGLLLPHLYVGRRRSRRLAQFASEFPNAVEVVVRGIKSGLPLIDCLKIVATETQEPVRGEFKKIVEDQTLGMPLDEAVQRLPERIPLPESNFFAIVIAIQSRTGGSLSEALGNLSKVLRDRKKMQAKIKAMSSEAKASAGIIGTLPVLVAAAVYFTSPNYVGLLFSTLVGNVVLVACGIWMVIGTVAMRKMINFDF